MGLSSTVCQTSFSSQSLEHEPICELHPPNRPAGPHTLEPGPATLSSMNLLILGGTQFVGRHVVNAALERGHAVTLFSRGRKENPFPDLKHLTGDRSSDLSALEGRTFDAVVDVSGYTPEQLEKSCGVLRGRVGRYLFISTVSVYTDPGQHGPDETSALQTLEPLTEDVTAETYGPLKVNAEKVVLEHFADRATVVRPHFVVGAFDHTDRFTSWVHKFARGGQVLLGGSQSDPCQFVDARDHADLVLHLLERDLKGTFNAARDPVTWGQVLEGVSTLTGNPVQAIEPDPVWLEAQQLEGDPFPMWIPVHSSYAGIARVQNQRSKATGFAYRSLEDTLSHVLEWDKARTGELKAGLTLEREQELIRAWGARG